MQANVLFPAKFSQLKCIYVQGEDEQTAQKKGRWKSLPVSSTLNYTNTLSQLLAFSLYPQAYDVISMHMEIVSAVQLILKFECYIC